jgi:virginiamycin B lyase
MDRVRYPSIDEPFTPAASGNRPPLRERRGRDAGFALAVLAIGVLTVFVLTRGGAAVQPIPAAVGVPTRTAASQSGGVIPAPLHMYAMPGPHLDLMQPALDRYGHVWFGEMGTNRLGRLDPRTGHVDDWTPPGGQYGIMDIAVAPDGSIWFTEQSANYVGRFNPQTEQFQTFPLAVRGGHTAAPQDLAFDTRGHLWFTEVTLGAIGQLDPVTGAIRTWPIPPVAPGRPTYPYALALEPDGTVWFSELAGGTLGQLDPANGNVRLFRTPSGDAQIFSLAVGPDSTLWFSELQYGKLGSLDPRTGAIHEYGIPTAVSPTPNLYDVGVAPDGTVWAASMGQNAIARYIPATGIFTLFELPDPQSQPYGLTVDSAGRIWFTADRDPINYVGMLDPSAASH